MNSTIRQNDDIIICNGLNTIPILNGTVNDWLFTDTDRIIVTILIPIIIIVGVIGNSSFLFMIARLKRMQTLTNCYLANIAVADIMLITYGPILYVVSYLKSPIVHYFPIEGVAGCFSAFFIANVGYFASVNIVTLVSMDRWMAICRPLYHRRVKSKGRTVKLITSAWCIALVTTLLYVPKYGKSAWFCMNWPNVKDHEALPKYLHTCVAMSPHFETHPEILELLALVFGLFINGTFYIMIIHALNNRPMGDKSKPGDQIIAIRNQVARLLIINGIVFFICQLPLRVSNVNGISKNLFAKDLLTKSQYDSVTIFGRSFQYMNSAVNVFIYAFSSSFYRNGFRDAFSFSRKSPNKQEDAVPGPPGVASSNI